MAERPLIGVTTPPRGRRAGWLSCQWAIWRAGGRARRLCPGDAPAIDGLAGLVLSGGDDIGELLYRPEKADAEAVDPESDAFERTLAAAAIEARLPLLGICRGAQMINVVQGGTLFADFPRVFPAARRRRTLLPRKRVIIEDESRLYRIAGHTRFRVNSLHHQAVDRLGEGLAISAQDVHGVVQAIEGMGDAFVLGVQWHPEYMVWSTLSRRLFGALCDAAE